MPCSIAEEPISRRQPLCLRDAGLLYDRIKRLGHSCLFMTNELCVQEEWRWLLWVGEVPLQL